MPYVKDVCLFMLGVISSFNSSFQCQLAAVATFWTEREVAWMGLSWISACRQGRGRHAEWFDKLLR
jgi:hypothetical protein